MAVVRELDFLETSGSCWVNALALEGAPPLENVPMLLEESMATLRPALSTPEATEATRSTFAELSASQLEDIAESRTGAAAAAEAGGGGLESETGRLRAALKKL